MAEVLETYQFGGVVGNPQYPYDQWFDGQIWKLYKSSDVKRDFDCGISSMRVNLYNAAKKKGIKIRTVCGPDHVIVQRRD